jgi:hypothetical protein
VETLPVRWALICTTQFTLPVIRLITEDRIKVWQDCGWTVICRDTDVIFEGLDDVYKADQQGRR